MNYDNIKYSGCFFSESKYINNHYEKYGERKYMSVFDTLDCKLSRYFGYYTSNLTSPPIISILIMGIFSFGLAILMMIPVLLVFVSLLFFVVRAGYLFMVNSLALTILLFLSPLFIPLVLFEKTRPWFKSWLVKIMQYTLSPLFLFMSLSMFLTVFDKYYVGEALFMGNREPIRDIYCGKICKVGEGMFFYIGGTTTEVSDQERECATAKGKVIDLIHESPLCLMTRAPDLQIDTGITVLNLILEDFAGLPGLAIQMTNFFLMFSNLIFLLALIFIFEEMTTYVSGITSAMFSYENIGFKGIDAGASGLPALKDVMSAVASAGAKVANFTKAPGMNLVRRGKDAAMGKIKEKLRGGGQKDDGGGGGGQNDSGGGGGGQNDSGGGGGGDGK
jgi:uncharacterized membrane protein YgcG